MELSEKFSCFYRENIKSDDYLKTDNLKDCFVYQIIARNAYVGVWVEAKKGFMISRYKVGSCSYLFYEYHWDSDNKEIFPYGMEKPILGTVKPLKLIEKFPFELKDLYSDEETNNILGYLDTTEENNPLVEGFDSLKDRRDTAIWHEKKLSGEIYTDEQLFRWLKRNPLQSKAVHNLLIKRGYSSKAIKNYLNK